MEILFFEVFEHAGSILHKILRGAVKFQIFWKKNPRPERKYLAASGGLQTANLSESAQMEQNHTQSLNGCNFFDFDPFELKLCGIDAEFNSASIPHTRRPKPRQ